MITISSILAVTAASLQAVPAFAGDGTRKAIVLVHGGFVDGSGWEGVY
jgi:hypothetical protein